MNRILIALFWFSFQAHCSQKYLQNWEFLKAHCEDQLASHFMLSLYCSKSTFPIVLKKKKRLFNSHFQPRSLILMPFWLSQRYQAKQVPKQLLSLPATENRDPLSIFSGLGKSPDHTSSYKIYTHSLLHWSPSPNPIDFYLAHIHNLLCLFIFTVNTQVRASIICFLDYLLPSSLAFFQPGLQSVSGWILSNPPSA